MIPEAGIRSCIALKVVYPKEVRSRAEKLSQIINITIHALFSGVQATYLPMQLFAKANVNRIMVIRYI